MVKNSCLENNAVIHILHVDDDPALLEISKEILMEMGKYEIDHALCVDEAFKKLEINKYDVIISDYEMPKKDGLQFLKELLKRNIQTPFILFTGKGREEVAIKALNFGADGYYNKQGSPETVYGELSHSINLLVERNQTKKALKEQETRFIKLASQTPGMLYQFLRRPDGTYCVPFASDGIRDIFGCSPKEVENDFSPISKVILPEDLQKVIQSIEQSAKNLSVWQCEYRVKLPNQKIRWMWGQSSPEKSKDGSVIWNGFNMDITERKLAEEKLRETFEVLERVGEGIDAGLAIIGKDFHVVWANKRLMDLGVSPNKKCYQTFNRLDTVCPDCGVKKIFENDLPLDVHEFKTINTRGETIWIELRVTPLKNKTGNTSAALELAVDVTERKKAEQILAESEKKYRLLADNMSDVIWTADLESHFTYVSPSVLQLRGFTPEEVMEKSIFEALTPASAQIVLEGIQHFKETGEISSSYELEQPCKDGSTVWTEVNFTILRDEKGEPRSILGVSRNITERKRTEEKNKNLRDMLEKSEEQNRAVIANAPIGIATSDSNSYFLSANQRFCEILGYEEEELKKLTFKDITFPEDIPQSIVKMGELVSGQIEFFIQEKRYIRKDGTVIFGRIMVGAIRDKEDKSILFVAELEDITEEKEIKESLIRSRRLYADLYEQSPLGYQSLDAEGKIITVNQAWLKLLGYRRKEVIGHWFGDFLVPNQTTLFIERFPRFKAAGKTYTEFEMKHKDGSVRLIAFYGKIGNDHKGNFKQTHCVLQDITEKKRVEVQLKISEERFKQLFSKMPSGVVVYEAINGGKNFIIKDINKAAEQIEHISRNQVIGKRVTEAFPGVKNLGLFDVLLRVFQTGKCEFLPINIYKDAKTQDSWRENWVYKLPNENVVAIYNDVTERKKAENELLRNKTLLLEAEKAGNIGGFEFDVNTLTQKWTEETFRILELNETQNEPSVPKGIEFINPEYRSRAKAAIQLAIEHGEPYDQEWEITTQKGNKRWVHALGRANWENGKIKTISGSLQDITERKLAEKRLKEDNYRIEILNEKLRIVGGLTRHDVVNKLAVIGANEFLLRKRLGDKQELTRYLDSIKKAVENSNELFEFSRLYERIGSEKLAVVDVFESFNLAVAMFSNKSTLNIINKCQGLKVVADSLLNHLFYNFVDNSIKHGKKVTEIRLHYTTNWDDIKLFYEDNGVGIPEDKKPRLFNVGLADRNIGGMGMFFAKKLMNVYGWSIIEEGKPGEGAKFVITIPKSNKGTENKI